VIVSGILAPDVTDDADLFAGVVQNRASGVRLLGRYGDDETDAAVECALHLRRRDIAGCSQPVEYGRACPACGFNQCAEAIRNDTGHVFGQAATGYMSHRVHVDAREQGVNRRYINAGGGEQGIDQGCLAHGRIRSGPGDIEHTPDQRVTVGVRTTGSQPQYDIAGGRVATVNARIMLDDTDAKAGQIEIALSIHAGHFRCFTTDQCGTRLATAGDNAVDDCRRDRRIQLRCGIVVEEKQRLSAGDQDIVDAHGDQIDTDAVETAAVDGQAQFGADAIGTGNEYGASIALDWQLEQAAEPAQAADDFRT